MPRETFKIEVPANRVGARDHWRAAAADDFARSRLNAEITPNDDGSYSLTTDDQRSANAAPAILKFNYGLNVTQFASGPGFGG